LYDSRALQVILDMVLPFFALIFCRYAASRPRLLDERDADGVNVFVFTSPRQPPFRPDGDSP